MLTEVEAHELFGGRLLAFRCGNGMLSPMDLPLQSMSVKPIVIAPGPAGEIGIEDPSSLS